MSFGSYGGRCIGRVMAFLYEYAVRSDEWQFGNGTIIVRGKTVGTYTWKGITDIPEFNFTDPDYKYLNEEHKRRWFERAKYLQHFKKTPRPYFDTDFQDQKEYTTSDNIKSYMGGPWRDAFMEVYNGDPKKIPEAEYNQIAKQLNDEAYAFLNEVKKPNAM